MNTDCKRFRRENRCPVGFSFCGRQVNEFNGAIVYESRSLLARYRPYSPRRISRACGLQSDCGLSGRGGCRKNQKDECSERFQLPALASAMRICELPCCRAPIHEMSDEELDHLHRRRDAVLLLTEPVALVRE